MGRGRPGRFCDIEQRLCLGLALWNDRDPILKERPFGLTGPQGNHGEDVKEYWRYLDATPTHSWNRWRYHYPQCAYPYQDLVAQNAARGRLLPECELIDTGAFDSGRYWITEVRFSTTGPALLFCEDETNTGRLYGTACPTPYPKDGINDHVISGAATVNPDRTGTKRAFWYQLTVPPGQTAELRQPVVELRDRGTYR